MNKLKNFITRQVWTGRFTAMWIASVLTFLWFDLEWCQLTTMRPLSSLLTYASALTVATVAALPTALLPRRLWFQRVILTILDFLLIANLMYCRTYNGAIPPSSYALAGNLQDFGASVLDSVSVLDFTFFVITGGGLWFASHNRQVNAKPSAVGYMSLLAGCTTLWCAAQVMTGLSPLSNMRAMTNNAHTHNSIPVVYTIFGRLYYDIATTPSPPDETEIKRLKTDIDNHRLLLNRPNVKTSAAYPQNLVYVIVESLESWPIGAVVEGQEVTPNLNSLINDSTTLYVPNVLSQADAGRSIDGQLALMTGLAPMRGTAFSTSTQLSALPSLHSEFAARNNGATSTILTADNPKSWNLEGVAHAFGAGKLLSREYWGDGLRTAGHTLYDEPFMKSVVRHIDNGDISLAEPYMLEVMTYSTHNPFVTHPDLKRLKLKNKYPLHIDDYMIAINATDHAIGLLLDCLRKQPDFDRTLIVITGDHEGLANYRKDAVRHPATCNLVNTEQFTPFIAANSPVGGRIDKVVGQIDLYTTVLDLMEWTPTAGWRGLGMSAVDPRHPGCAIAPDGSVHGQGHPPEWMTAARNQSDQILRFNLMPQILL